MKITLDLDLEELSALPVFGLYNGSSLVKATPKNGPRPKQTEYEKLYNYFKDYPSDSLIAGTITIGRQWIGKLDYREQYNIIRNDMRREWGSRNTPHKYYAAPELTKSGQLHFHLILYNMYQSTFQSVAATYGSRNKHKESFKPISNLKSYLDYITKDTGELNLKPVHNIYFSRSPPEHYEIESDIEL